jgi:RNA polymerase sigma-70 factor (ECF subfamily)
LNSFFTARSRQPQGTGRTTVRRLLEGHPAPEELVNWDREYDRRLFDWAVEQVRGEFKESTWQAFWRTAVAGDSGQETASALGLSVGAVYIAKSRVVARLREVIASADGQSPPWTGTPPPAAPSRARERVSSPGGN